MDLTRYDKLRSAIRRTLSPDEAAAADRALEYAAEHTASQVRHDGSPMLDHAAEVARIGLEEIGLGGDSVVAAILHDVVRTASRQDEETFLRLTDEIRDRFGKEVLGMTVSLSHISDIRLKASREQAENFRELIVSYSEDPRVILIKLADRLEVMRRLEIFPREKWRKKSWESLNLYAQIAHKLGLYNIKSELEDLHGNLRKLNLSNNKITKISSKITALKNLRTLDLSYNKLTQLHAAIFKLPNLRTLIISNNAIKTLPKQIANLSKLKIFIAPNNKITDANLELLPNSLTKLNLTNNYISTLVSR